MTALYLASSSQSRQQLLRDAGFSFEVLKTSSHPEPFDTQASLQKNVGDAALFKAKTVILPDPNVATAPIIVITADTLIADVAGNILRKPADLADAHQQLRQLRAGKCRIGTAVVVQKFELSQHKEWRSAQVEQLYSESHAEFYVPDEQFEAYFSHLPFALHACGSGIIEGFGAQFLKSFSGSYSGALGLPVYEVAATLKKLSPTK